MAKGYIVYTEQIHDQMKMDEYGAIAMPALFGHSAANDCQAVGP